MNILISNDDGISAEGIRALAEAMSDFGDVYVVAPHTQRSASSHALSVNGKITVKEAYLPGAVLAYECDGTPADCVKLGMDILRRRGIEIDIVYSGINHGGNLGTDTMYSGTVSAAAEGILEGIPAVAVSVNSHQATHFDAACRLAAEVLPTAIENKGKIGVISINTPDLPAEQIKGVKTARLGKVEYSTNFKQVESCGEKTTYIYSGTLEESDSWTEDADIKLIRMGYATVSAVKYDLNDYDGLKEIDKWELKL